MKGLLERQGLSKLGFPAGVSCGFAHEKEYQVNVNTFAYVNACLQIFIYVYRFGRILLNTCIHTHTLLHTHTHTQRFKQGTPQFTNTSELRRPSLVEPPSFCLLPHGLGSYMHFPTCTRASSHLLITAVWTRPQRETCSVSPKP